MNELKWIKLDKLYNLIQELIRLQLHTSFITWAEQQEFPTKLNMFTELIIYSNKFHWKHDELHH